MNVTATESTRLTAIDSLPCAGYFPKLVEQLKADGTSAETAATKILLALESEHKATTGSNSERAEGLRKYHAKVRGEGRSLSFAEASAELHAGGRLLSPAARVAEKVKAHIAAEAKNGRQISCAQAYAEISH